jgi:DNA-binding NtrC family response regulator
VILLVEDEESVRSLVRRTLEKAGYTVLEAAGSEEGLRISRTRPDPIDLLLTDVVMPGMTGPNLAQEMALSRDGLRVLYMSGYTDKPIVEFARREDETSFLQKPFMPDDLLRAVRRALERTPASAALERSTDSSPCGSRGG